MDPDKTLTDALEAAREVADLSAPMGPAGAQALAVSAERLAEAVLALDEWIAKGGYLPARWRPSGGEVQPSADTEMWIEGGL